MMVYGLFPLSGLCVGFDIHQSKNQTAFQADSLVKILDCKRVIQRWQAVDA